MPLKDKPNMKKSLHMKSWWATGRVRLREYNYLHVCFASKNNFVVVLVCPPDWAVCWLCWCWCFPLVSAATTPPRLNKSKSSASLQIHQRGLIERVSERERECKPTDTSERIDRKSASLQIHQRGSIERVQA